MKNTIAERIFDFLKDYPPFDFLDKVELNTICENIEVLYMDQEQYVFRQEESVHKCFYVIREGAVALETELDNLMVDQCDEGDIFGLRAVVRKKEYLLSARTLEETILYCIPSQFYEQFIINNPKANQFLLAALAGHSIPPLEDKKEKDQVFIKNLNSKVKLYTSAQSATFSENPITCKKELSILKAAEIMAERNIGSILVSDENSFPIGIVTDKDLRKKVATGKFGLEQKVAEIMSAPVITAPPKISSSEALLLMLKLNITHLCITENGGPNAKITGILSEHDLLVSQGNHPASFLKEIKRSANIIQLKQIRKQTQNLLQGYLNQGIPIDFVLKIISLINESITKRIIEISISQMENIPPVNFAWLSLGSQGRREQLLLSDQDNALMFSNVPAEEYSIVKGYFLLLANKINLALMEIGFEYCPAEMMGNNPKWCLTLDQWKAQFDDWITNPDEDKIMLSTIFFDFQRVYGDPNLETDLSNSILASLENYEFFLNRLALNAIKNPPPLGFFRNFMVERTGENKDQFDIKLRAIMPLVDAARVLILSNHKTGINNTLDRYQKLIELEPQNKEIYLSCIEAYKTLVEFRTSQGVLNKNTGRYVHLESLNKTDRLKLKNCFKPIHEVQKLIQVRFQLAQMM